MKKLIARYDYDEGDLWAEAYRTEDGKLMTHQDRHFYGPTYVELTEQSLLNTYQRQAIIRLIPLLEEEGDFARANWLRENCLMKKEHRVWIELIDDDGRLIVATELLTRQGRVADIDAYGEWHNPFPTVEQWRKLVAALADSFARATTLLEENEYKDTSWNLAEEIDLCEETLDVDGSHIKARIHLPIGLFSPWHD